MNWFLFGEESRKNGTDARTATVTNRWYGPAVVVDKEKNNVFVSYRGRVTKVAPEFLRKASVAEQMSLGHRDEGESLVRNGTRWGKLLVGRTPLLAESGEFHESEKPDTMARPQNLEEDINSPVNDDGDLPFSEPGAEKDRSE